jgi:hypothetical protein
LVAPFFTASTMPSNPILISVIDVTPFFVQVSNSVLVMAREALEMSGCCVPTPAQNSRMPPPVPVDSTIGALRPEVRANCSATVVVNGNTVEEPTARIWSRACCASAITGTPRARAATAEKRRERNVIGASWRVDRMLQPYPPGTALMRRFCYAWMTPINPRPMRPQPIGTKR